MRWLLLVLAACGSAPPPPAPIAPPPPTKPAGPPAKVSCADAGTILRGSVEDSRKAGPAKEAAIASACMFDKWSQEILDCIGSSQAPQGCLGKLTTEQRTALDTKMTSWVNIYENETWETLEEEEAASAVECVDVIGDVAAYTPVPSATGEERDFVIKLRRHHVLAQCESWAQPVRKCFQDKGPVACRSTLSADSELAMSTMFRKTDELLAKIADAKKKPPATFDCKAVVAVRYADAAWKGKAEPPKNPKATRAELAKQAADRKQMIADSRKLMLAACTAEGWNATIRACEVVEGGEPCARALGRPVRWGYPAVGVMTTSTGIAECDAYAQSIQVLLGCDKFPQQSKDAINQGFTVMREGMTNIKPDQIQMMTSSCKQADDAIRQAITAVGCTP